MPNQSICITKGYPGGHLDLSDGGYTNARRSDNVTWHIAKGANVQSIAKIEKKSHSQDIFVPGHPHRQGDRWTGNIKNDVEDGSNYLYNIFWINENGRREKHDPIISIRPSIGMGHLELVLIAAATTIFSLFVYRYWQQKKNKRKPQTK